MKEIRRYISKNWLWIVAGFILTEVFAKMAYVKRGYLAYGGEYLILPLLLMSVEIVRKVVITLRFLFETEEN